MQVKRIGLNTKVYYRFAQVTAIIGARQLVFGLFSAKLLFGFFVRHQGAREFSLLFVNCYFLDSPICLASFGENGRTEATLSKKYHSDMIKVTLNIK